MSLNVEKMQEYCRLCQENLGTIYVVDNDEFINKVFEFSNVKINNERMSVYPKSVCNTCHVNVEETINFIKHIQLIDQKLQDYFIRLDKLQADTDKISVTDCDKAEEFEKKCSISDITKYSNNYFKPKDKDDLEKDNFSNFYVDSPISNDQDALTIDSCSIVKTLDEPTANHVEMPKDLDSSLNDLSDEDSNSESLDVELKKATYKNAFPCTYDNCSKICTSSYTLRTHLMKHEGKTPFLCVTCGKGFRTKNSLNCHEKIHAKVKAYVCTECNIRFSVSSNLRAHQRKHHEGIRYYCSQCPLVYISKYSLERHELVHTGIKEYKCGMCKAAFYTNKELTKHQRYHQGLRLYKCEECFKTFFEKHHLTIHMRGHTGERPYVCKIAGCGKSFTESQKLTRHLKARHPLI